ncbi:nuclease Le1 [Schizopora paradoxa]|uniref:Nuclease Le1 n=1 Tax=Schizopora paradoxa TaxID=27342 RepID=A0A0H2RKI4_9AGAM|nr:nuclease Le1 [Schizopora paradoxa]
MLRFQALCASVIIAVGALKGVVAWGDLGHETVGYVAMSFLAPKALSFVQSTISDSDDNSLGPAATWADSVREEASFTFTAPFHFVDAEDDPKGGSCSVVESRDCGSEGCLFTAIANYTQRVTDTSLSATQRQEALKFIDHFLGDIGQPLHVEALEVGGNDIDAICGGKATNLHAAWDTGMIETMLDVDFSGSSKDWAASLVTEIKTGDFKSLAAGWISCSSTTEPLSQKRSLKDEIMETISTRATTKPVTPLACPLVWAQESNAFDCTDVFDFKTGQDLCTGTYFNSAIPIIKLQIAKQGFRLAAWLNVIFDGETNLP